MKCMDVILLASLLSSAECFFWGVQWLWKSPAPDNRPAIGTVIDNIPVPNVQYETKTDDEKFLEAAKKYTDLQLSELDSCQHKIVMQIRTSCSDMSEEDISKLSVNLLNCQSSVEGRRLYPCNENMALKDCTRDMDPDTWNAYHLMTNRARAVCYAARQQQFRALSEMTVNKLMSTAHDQLSAMEQLKAGQQKLESFTLGTLQTVAEGQDSLLQQQERMRVVQQGLRDFVGQNLRELTREKALIAAGHKELSKLTEDIKEKLDAASAQLLQQSSEQSGNHQQIVKDLEFIKEKAQVIWSEIEASTQEILAQHEAATVKYEETMEKLAKINATVTFLLQLMEKMHVELNDRLGWLSHVVGAAGIYTFSMHIIYLLMGMIATAFVQAPPFTKLSLLLIVPLNLAVIYHHGYDSALGYFTMTLILIVLTAVHWLITSLLLFTRTKTYSPMRLYQSPKLVNGSIYTVLPEPQKSQVSSWLDTCHGSVSNFFEKSKQWINQHSSVMNEKRFSDRDSGADVDNASDDSDTVSEAAGQAIGSRRRGYADRVRQRENSYAERMRQSENVSVQRRFPPTPPRTYSRSGSPPLPSSTRGSTPKSICVAYCRNGTPCRNSAATGHSMCRVHLPE